jgi:diacylglycerol kinase (ATP)
MNQVQQTEFNLEVAKIRNELESIVAFVNPKSGGQKGQHVIESLKNYLNKDNVYDITKGGPEPGLEKHKHKNNLKIIACGGDGTVGWVLSVLDEMDFGSNRPAVAIIPLGTGNDLARTLGWGGGFNNESIKGILNKIINGDIQLLDRWSIKINIRNNGIPLNELVRSAKANLPLTVMNNYFSIGADSKIALDFHEAREKNPGQFTSQALNYVEYVKVFNFIYMFKLMS